MFLSLTAVSCSTKDQPNYSDNNVQSLLKEIYLEKVNQEQPFHQNRDTSEYLVSGIRTLSRNEEFSSCECAAKIIAQGKALHVIKGMDQYLISIDEDITYIAQFTDDGKHIYVKIHQKNE